ncbi:hypothetical protein ES705_40955 [subsurface metagenome]
MEKDKWLWMPHPGHLIVARDCRFSLNTYVGKYIVSTVGEYLPDYEVREILVRSRGIILKGKGDERLADYMRKVGYEDIGLNRKYETMVFPSRKSGDKCCPYVAKDWSNVNFDSYNSAEDAFSGHYKMCLKWAKK